MYNLTNIDGLLQEVKYIFQGPILKFAIHRSISCIFLALILANFLAQHVHLFIWMFILEMGRYNNIHLPVFYYEI